MRGEEDGAAEPGLGRGEQFGDFAGFGDYFARAGLADAGDLSGEIGASGDRGHVADERRESRPVVVGGGGVEVLLPAGYEGLEVQRSQLVDCAAACELGERRRWRLVARA